MVLFPKFLGLKVQICHQVLAQTPHFSTTTKNYQCMSGAKPRAKLSKNLQPFC